MLNIDQEQLGELLTAYIDGELGVRDVEIVERWLRDDEGVRAEYEALRATVVSVQSLPRHRPPAALSEDLLAQLERHDLLDDTASAVLVKPARRFRWVSTLATAAVVGVVAFVGLRQTDWWKPDHTASPIPQRIRITTTSSAVGTSADVATELDRRAEKRVEYADEVADRTPLEAKLGTGTTTDAVRTHSFSAETVRLTVAMERPDAVEAAVKRLVSHLAGSDMLDISTKHGVALGAKSGAFFLEGKPGVNFEEKRTRQVLVRLPASAVDDLLDEVAADASHATSVKLTAGALSADGLDDARDTLYRHAGGSASGVTHDARKRRAARRRGRRAARLASREQPKTLPEEEPAPDATVVGIFDTLGIPQSALGKGRTAKAHSDHDTSVADGTFALDRAVASATNLRAATDEAKASANQPMALSQKTRAKKKPGLAGRGAVSADAWGAGVPARKALGVAAPQRFVTLVVEFSAPPRATRPTRTPAVQPGTRDTKAHGKNQPTSPKQ